VLVPEESKTKMTCTNCKKTCRSIGTYRGIRQYQCRHCGKISPENFQAQSNFNPTIAAPVGSFETTLGCITLEELLTEHDVARITGVSVATVRRWRMFGQGPKFLKLNSSVRYRPEDLKAWLELRPTGGGKEKDVR